MELVHGAHGNKSESPKSLFLCSQKEAAEMFPVHENLDEVMKALQSMILTKMLPPKLYVYTKTC